MKKLIKKYFWIAPLVFAIAAPALAAVSSEGWNPQNYASTGLPNPEGGFTAILLAVIDYAIIIVGLLCVAVFIYGGFLYLTAQGESERIETAKKVLIYAVIGVVVSVLGLVVVYTVDRLLRGENPSTGAPSSTSGAPAAAPAPGGPGPGDSSAPLPVGSGMMGQ